MSKSNPEIHEQQLEASSAQELVKATFYITPDQVIALEELKLKLRKQGEKADKSELIRRAIDLLIEQANQA
jgi:hypothetical protein